MNETYAKPIPIPSEESKPFWEACRRHEFRLQRCAAVPYPVALIALDEGPRFLSNVVDCPVEDLRVGMPVEVVFADVTDDCTLPKFRPSS